jgi:hypothetical protein
MSKYRVYCIVITGILCCASFGIAQPKVHVEAKDGSGIIGYKDTPIQPWSGYHVHDPDRPAPSKVTPGIVGTQKVAGTAPSDAVVLFGGTDLSQWQSSQWSVSGDVIVVGKGHLESKQSFGDMQLHVEWRVPNPPQGRVMDQGNSGILLAGLYEIQVFDSWTNAIYPDGQAAAIYGQTPPQVNACREPGQWQSYDILFTTPVYQFGRLAKRASVTVLHNGLLVHHNAEIMGETPHRVIGYYPEPAVTEGPVVLMGHNNPVEYRNVWVRPM